MDPIVNTTHQNDSKQGGVKSSDHVVVTPPVDVRELQVGAIAEEILQKVVFPISRPLDGVAVSIINEPPTLVLSQTVKNPQGNEVHYRYEITLETDKISLGIFPADDGIRRLGFPAPPYSEKQITAMQDAFRCASIDHLNERYASREFKLTDYQNEAIAAVIRDLHETGSALIVVGTGGGKTEIIFEVIDRELSKLSSPEDGRAIFVVNNNVILDEAGEKFVKRFNDKHSSSHLHGGEKDLSGAHVFTTPTSLATGGRLRELCLGKKEVLLVIDECHHTPANVLANLIKEATDLSKELGFVLKIMGTTATETRPDLKSVLAFFNNHISYEMPAADLTRRGYLVPFRYQAHDSWLYSGKELPKVMLPGEEKDIERRALLNSPEAFPYVKEALDKFVLTKDDKRTLIVAPNVALAGQFVTYLSQFPEYKDQVVRLAGADKYQDQTAFKATYEAWKKGKGETPDAIVPKIVVAVDLFKEGTDAPGIRNLIMWKDINSLISFVQILGRGLRPDQFKEYLEVVDVAGIFRKLHLLQWLGNFANQSDESLADRQRERESNEERDSAIASSVERPLCQLSEDVSNTVADFMKNIPSVIARRYPGVSYSSIPSEALVKLHEFVAERCGFESTFEFERFLDQEGKKLIIDSSATAEKLLRDKLLPAFMVDPSEDRGGYTILGRSPEMLLVHAHLLEMFQVHCKDFTPEHFARVFPEFSREALDLARVIGGNLAALRRAYFNLDILDMTKELVDKVLAPGRLDHDEFAKDHLRYLSLDDLECTEAFTIAEGRRPSGQRTTSIPEHYDQVVISKAYVNHPDITGKLQESDFKLPRVEFENLLITKGLVTLDEEGGSLRRDFTKLMDRKIEVLLKILESGESLKVESAIEIAKAVLFAGPLIEHFQDNQVSSSRYNKIEEWITTLQSHKETYPSLLPLIVKLEKVRDAMIGLEETLIGGGGDFILCSYQLPDTKSVELRVIKREPTGEKSEIGQAVLFVKSDLHRTHILFETSSLERLQKCVETLPPPEQQNFLNSLTPLLEKINYQIFRRSPEGASSKRAPVFVLPVSNEEPGQTLLHNLTQDILKNTALQVIVGGPKVSSGAGYSNLEPSVTQALMARAEGINEALLKSLRQQTGSSSISFTRDLKRLYELIYFSRTRIAPHSAAWEKTLENVEHLSGRDLRYAELARAPYEKLIKGGTTIYPKLLESLKTYCSLLDGIQAEGRLTSHTALLVAAWSAWDVFPMGSFDQKTSPVREVNGMISLLFSRLTTVVEAGIKLPRAMEEETNEVLMTLFHTFFNADRNRTLLFSEVSIGEQHEYAEQLKQRITTITNTLLEMQEATQSKNIQTPTPLHTSEERKQGHPFFDANNEPVFFLSGSKRAPVMHLDPGCARLIADLEKRKKKELPLGPVTEDSMIDAGVFSDKIKCCEGCNTPTKGQRQNYPDIRGRFVYREGISVRLPHELAAQVITRFGDS